MSIYSTVYIYIYIYIIILACKTILYAYLYIVTYILVQKKKENIIKLYLNSLKGGLSQSVYAPDIAPWTGSCTLISSAQSLC